MPNGSGSALFSHRLTENMVHQQITAVRHDKVQWVIDNLRQTYQNMHADLCYSLLAV